jgi:choline kinase
LYRGGIKQRAIVGGYKSEFIEPFCDKFYFNKNWKRGSIVRSLLTAIDWLEKYECIISYSDIFYRSKIIKQLINFDQYDISIVYDRKWIDLWTQRFRKPEDDAETFNCDSSKNLLLEIGNRVDNIKDMKDIKGQYMGLTKITPKGWLSINNLLDKLSNDEIDRMDMTSLFRELLKNNINIGCIPTRGNWGEIDQIEDLILYNSLIKNGKIKLEIC